jgi:molybdate transport system substrate-binding protein
MRPHVSSRRCWLTCCACALIVVLTSCGRSASAPAAKPRKVSVAAASDLKFALDEIVATFEKAHPEIDVETTYGSSGNFFAQLSSRAPFDVYFSADIEYPRKLIDAGLADKNTEFQYAVGKIVVWTRKDSPLDVEAQGIQSLCGENVRKIAIANPAHAPYGRAAEAAFQQLGVYEQVKHKLVLGENIAQTAQFIESGSADVGVIALSLALAPAMQDQGKFWPVPLDAYSKMEQGGVILKWAQDREAAESLRAYVLGEEGRATLKRYGFD